MSSPLFISVVITLNLEPQNVNQLMGRTRTANLSCTSLCIFGQHL